MERVINYIKNNKLLSIILLLGFAVTMLTTLPSGSRYCVSGECGIFFWGAHEFDAVWHLSLVNNAFDSTPFMNPIYAGKVLSGYNYFLDLILYGLTLIGIPAIVSYFKILPLVWFPLIVWITLKLTKQLKKNNIFTSFLFFFIFFGSTFMYMFTYFYEGTIFKLHSFGGGLNLINMQYGYSLIVFIAIMYVLEKMHPTLKRNIIIGALVFISTALKFYAGFMTGFFVLLYFSIKLFKTKDFVTFIKGTSILVGFSLAAIFLIYDPLNASIAEDPILTFDPFVHSRRIIEEPDQLNLKNLVLARYALQEGGLGPKLLAIELFSLGLYLLFNFGTRIISFWTATKKTIQKQLSTLDASILGTMIIGIAMLALFVQRGQWWNTVQFFYYSLFLSSFFAAEFMSDLLKKKTAKTITIAAVIILLTVPFNLDVIRTFGDLRHPSSHIPDMELEALEFLRSQPDGTVLTVVPPVETSALPKTYKKDSPYVSAFGYKDSYLVGKVNLELLGIDFNERLEKKNRLDPSILSEIDYVYAHNGADLTPILLGIEQEFSNQFVTIYRVK